MKWVLLALVVFIAACTLVYVSGTDNSVNADKKADLIVKPAPAPLAPLK